MNDFGNGVAEPTGSNVVDGEYRTLCTHTHTGIDDLLGSALELGVFSLHGGKVECCVYIGLILCEEVGAEYWGGVWTFTDNWSTVEVEHKEKTYRHSDYRYSWSSQPHLRDQ